MTENVKKIFEMLNLKPYEEFEIEEDFFRFREDLTLEHFWNNNWHALIFEYKTLRILCGKDKIVKLPQTKKVKLRDLTLEQYKKLYEKEVFCKSFCYDCDNCKFGAVNCNPKADCCWVNHKDLYSDKFLDQEIEIKE